MKYSTIENLNEDDVEGDLFIDCTSGENFSNSEEIDESARDLGFHKIHHMRCAVHTFQLEIHDSFNKGEFLR